MRYVLGRESNEYLESTKRDCEMTPKEKAEDLLMKFSNPFAKSCALIAVGEILDLIDTIYDYDRESLNPYWQEVKKEIEKL
jgi:hypothetical protein